MENNIRKKYGGQITLEAAIVIPIIMLIIISLIYLSMYIHDVMVIRAYVYRTGNEAASMEYKEFQNMLSDKLKHAPLFAVKPALKFEEHLDSYEVKVQGKGYFNISWMNTIINTVYPQESIEIEKEMSRDVIYVSQVIQDFLKDNHKTDEKNERK